jgi:TP901 family phage tail tape measure protein
MASGDFLARIKLALEGKDKVVSGLAETQRAAQQLSKTKITTIFDKEGLVTGKKIEETFKDIGTAGNKSFQAMGDFEKALRRVVLVAPVWMAFRTIIQGVMSTISEGFQTWENFDKQLIKSKAVIHDFSGTTEQAMTQLEDTIRSFSKESGIALDELASSFYRFGTVGIAFEDSLSGAIASAKLAKGTLGDVDTISRSLAMTYRLLGDTIDSTLSPMAKQESLAGKILHLWRTNAFESNEFASSLGNFVSTANIANFTADQTVALLSALGTAGVQGARGGTLLKTAIQKLVDNLDDLAPKLGIAVNPELENTFDVFMRVLGAINDLSKTKGIPAEALESIRQIFGGVRGGQVVSALNALLPELKKNLEDLGRDPQEYIEGLNSRFREVTNTVSGQLEIFRRLKEQIGEAFVKGVLGGNDFKNSLITMNQLMEQLQVTASNIGGFFRFAGNPVSYIKKELKTTDEEAAAFAKQVEDAEAGLLSLQQTIEVITKISERWGDDAFTQDVIKRIQTTAAEIVNSSQMVDRLNKVVEDYNKNVIQAGQGIDEQTNRYKILLNQLELQRKDSIEGLKLIELQTKGAGESEIAFSKLTKEVDKMVELYNGLDKVIDGTLPKLDKQTILTDILNRNWQGIIDKAKGNVTIIDNLTKLAQSRDKLEAAVLQQYIKQDEAIRSQYINYAKADMFERDRLRRLMELQALDPTELAQRFEGSVYDQRIITEYWSAFNKEGQNAINSVIQRLYNLPKLDLSTIFGNANINTVGGAAAPAPITNTIIGADIKQININLPDVNWESLADQAGQKVAERLKSDEAFQELVAKGIRDKI